MGWKALEVLGVLLAGGLFAWWQFRDLRQAARQREQAEAQASQPEQTEPEQAEPQAESEHER